MTETTKGQKTRSTFEKAKSKSSTRYLALMRSDATSETIEKIHQALEGNPDQTEICKMLEKPPELVALRTLQFLKINQGTPIALQRAQKELKRIWNHSIEFLEAYRGQITALDRHDLETAFELFFLELDSELGEGSTSERLTEAGTNNKRPVTISSPIELLQTVPRMRLLEKRNRRTARLRSR